MLTDIVGLFKAAAAHEEKRRKGLGRWGRFKEDFPSNLYAIFVFTLIFAVIILPWVLGVIEIVSRLIN